MELEATDPLFPIASSTVLLAMGKSGSVASSSIRVSLSYDTEDKDLERFLAVLEASVKKLVKLAR
jgi:cysteine desulfurase